MVAGFTAKELLTALAVALVRFQEGKPFFVNCYPRVVTREGSREAQRLVNELMEGCDSEWRGLGIIPGSGMQLREEWEAYDARKKYNMPKIEGKANPACRCGDVLQGKCKPSDCKVFGKVCTPQHPVGACMVSGEAHARLTICMIPGDKSQKSDASLLAGRLLTFIPAKT